MDCKKTIIAKYIPLSMESGYSKFQNRLPSYIIMYVCKCAHMYVYTNKCIEHLNIISMPKVYFYVCMYVITVHVYIHTYTHSPNSLKYSKAKHVNRILKLKSLNNY